MPDHDPGDEDRRDAYPTALDALAVAMDGCFRRTPASADATAQRLIRELGDAFNRELDAARAGWGTSP